MFFPPPFWVNLAWFFWPLATVPGLALSSFCLYYKSSLTKISNSSLSVSIVVWVSYLNCSLFSIWVFNNFLSFLLSSSSCLHFRAFRRMFSRLLPICWPTMLCWATPEDPWTPLTALTIPPAAEVLPFGPVELPCAPPEPVSLFGLLEPISLRINYLRFLNSSTYCNNASLFFWSICWDFSLHTSISSIDLSDNDVVELPSLVIRTATSAFLCC